MAIHLMKVLMSYVIVNTAFKTFFRSSDTMGGFFFPRGGIDKRKYETSIIIRSSQQIKHLCVL